MQMENKVFRLFPYLVSSSLGCGDPGASQDHAHVGSPSSKIHTQSADKLSEKLRDAFPYLCCQDALGGRARFRRIDGDGERCFSRGQRFN